MSTRSAPHRPIRGRLTSSACSPVRHRPRRYCVSSRGRGWGRVITGSFASISLGPIGGTQRVPASARRVDIVWGALPAFQKIPPRSRRYWGVVEARPQFPHRQVGLAGLRSNLPQAPRAATGRDVLCPSSESGPAASSCQTVADLLRRYTLDGQLRRWPRTAQWHRGFPERPMASWQQPRNSFSPARRWPTAEVCEKLASWLQAGGGEEAWRR